jgi:diadenylate cyclase
VLDVLERVFAGRSAAELLRDAVDILVVAYVIYRLLLTVRGTRAMQMGFGLGIVFLLYAAANVFELVTLLSLLQYVLSSIILVVVVVFQNDIRRALVRVGGRAWLGRGRKLEQSRVIDEVVASVTELARHRIGAIIAFEQDANLLEFTRSEGVQVGAAVTRELLVALFYPESVNKLHDGAVIIRDLKIERAGVFFPMPEARGLDRQLGTRHRAALGITEETDAVVVVVSEERGTISFCFNGNIVQNIDATSLRQTLMEILGQKVSANAPKRDPRRTSLPPPPPKAGSESSAPATTTPLARPAKAAATPGAAVEDIRRSESRGSDPPREAADREPVSTRSPSTPESRPTPSSRHDELRGPSSTEPPSDDVLSPRRLSVPMPKAAKTSPMRTPPPPKVDAERGDDSAPSKPSFVATSKPADEASASRGNGEGSNRSESAPPSSGRSAVPPPVGRGPSWSDEA